MISNHLCIVFAQEHYNPLGIIRSLGENGIRPIYIAVKRNVRIASYSKYISKCHFVDTVEEGYQVLIREYADYNEKPIIFTSDDKTTGYLDEHYNILKDKFIFFNAGEECRISQYMDRNNANILAKKIGINTLDSWIITDKSIPKGINYPVITKSISPNVGGWKKDVFICNSENELEKALPKIKSSIVFAQQFVEKKNECAFQGFSIKHGDEVCITIESDFKYLIRGYYSPFLNIRNVSNKKLVQQISEMIREIGFEGIFEAEFIVDQDNNYYFMEINFRNSTWAYASTCVGMPLPALWGNAMVRGFIKKDVIQDVPLNYTALVEPIDYGKRVDTGMISVAEWIKDFKEANCTYYYNENDLEPYFAMCSNWEKLK